MEEIVKLVSEKTGLSEEMSETVVTLVIDHLKSKLPEPIAGQLDGYLGGEGGSTGFFSEGLVSLFQ